MNELNALYTVEDKGTYKEVTFTDEATAQIIELFDKKQDPKYSATKILAELFPDIMNDTDTNVQKNATYEIQVILGRDYEGN
jgi:hypothetical protein